MRRRGDVAGASVTGCSIDFAVSASALAVSHRGASGSTVFADDGAGAEAFDAVASATAGAVLVVGASGAFVTSSVLGTTAA